MKTALIIVDMQQSLLNEQPWNAEELLKRVCGIVDLARSADAAIFFVTDRRVEPDPSLHSSLNPSSSDIFIEKGYCDSFLNTNLHAELQTKAIERLIIVGLQTDYCIDTTCRRGASLGYDVLLVGDAHSTFSHEHLSAEQIVSHHNRILRRLPAGNGSVSAIESSEVSFA